MDKTPKDLGIGTWGNIFTITKSTSVIDALRLFLERRVSALPLIDKNGKVCFEKWYSFFVSFLIFCKVG